MAKKLYKSRDRMLFGVCGGLAEYFDMDPTVMRIIFVASVLLFGTGVLLYLIMAIIVPDPPIGS